MLLTHVAPKKKRNRQQSDAELDFWPVDRYINSLCCLTQAGTATTNIDSMCSRIVIHSCIFSYNDSGDYSGGLCGVLWSALCLASTKCCMCGVCRISLCCHYFCKFKLCQSRMTETYRTSFHKKNDEGALYLTNQQKLITSNKLKDVTNHVLSG